MHMYIQLWSLIVMIVLYVYLIAMDIHLHKRVVKLEKLVRKLEGLREKEAIKEDMYEHEDLT